MDIIKPKDLVSANPELNYLGGELFAWFLMHVLRFHKLNKVYAKIENKTGLEFIEELIKILDLKTEVDENELKRIPSAGPVIIIANHPLGGLEGLLLIKLLSSVRSDIKILATYMLKRVEQVSEFFIDTRPKEQERENAEISFPGIKESSEHLRQGGILCVFPAEEINSWDKVSIATDKMWKISVIRFIRKMEVPVVPVLFQMNDSRLFKIISRIHPALKNVRLPSDLFQKRNKNIRIRIGNPIKKADQNNFSDIYQFGRYLRAKTYGMASPLEIKKFFRIPSQAPSEPVPVIDPVPKELILKEIQGVRSEHTLFKLKEYSVFVVPTREIPNIHTEIGRLREITFREVGEGTNLSIDIDEFDLYYHQMFIWDDKHEKIVGAYRIGFGHEIMAQYGKRGFYLHTLFRMDDSLGEFLNQSIEVGRSFIVKEYQKKPLSLFLLWKGFIYLLLKNPDHRYLIGPVSISNNYSRVSKDLIIRFIMANYFNYRIAQKIRPRHAYKFRSNDPTINILMESTERDINKLDKTIGDVDALNSGLPVLIKKYIKLGAKIACFNVDPTFSNCLDGMIVLDVYDIPKEAIESLSKEVNDGVILERFYSNRE
jgi:putative hemolysin